MTESDWPPHTYATRPYRQRTPRGPRADRMLREVTVALPPYIADLDLVLERPVAAMTTASAGALRHLDLVHGRTMAELNHLQLRTEAIDSSKIEHVEASLADYGRALLGIGANASAVSMASATQAMERLIQEADTSRKITSDAILRAHGDLFARHPDEAAGAGRFRTVQNWVGGSDYSPRDTMHVPPPPETVVEYIEDLVAFANRDDLAPIAQAAIVHAQFESIHPFIDGNGRIGRALIHAVLRRRRASRHLTVPIASALVAHRDRYFAALHDYRAGTPATIIAMLAASTTIATTESWKTAEALESIRQGWGKTAGSPRPGSAAYRLLDLLTAEPILNAGLVTEQLGVEDPQGTIDGLERVGVLSRIKRTRRSPVWVAPAVLAEVEDLSARIQDQARRLPYGPR
ncbi:Fic family protein [Nocardioides luteus]|uniref:Fic family protein n=1 Tax=Nocardioides luteus TaxID=1844 RepID=A0ABQ5SUV6_9ACTN|nr:Fic family protein [Nocardioides luteus]MDR7309829.1 Fic family protein [Nocardioides luteus]GGR72920.1 Fic family protein [Nocardioides luteus]GLJ67262.1 Fic family protein [Nocardioides luteus]